MKPLISRTTDALLQSEREALHGLRSLLEDLDAERQVLEQLDELIAHLEELFLVVIVGEFNAGKSSVINALFGEKIMEEGPIPTTAKITILRYGPEPLIRQLSEYVLERRYPAALLKHLNLVDTPGTNSIVRRHQEITEDFIPRADLILFVTSFDRPLSESERQFLQYVRSAWGKRLVFVLNKIDLGDEKGIELEQVLSYLKSSCSELMGFEPKVFPVSAELAYEYKTDGQGPQAQENWAKSRFAPLEQFVMDTLTGADQMTLKLRAPVDSGLKLLETFDQRLLAREEVLREDMQQLEVLREHFIEAESELRNGYGRYLTEIDNLLLQMERRGVQFLEDNIRVSKLRLLKDKDAFKEEFSRQVIRQSEREIEDRLTDGVDWLLRHVLGLWNWTLGRFNAQLRSRPAPGSSSTNNEFLYNRAEVFEKIRREAERRISAYDLHEEARRILENARSAAALFLGTEGIAAGIGAVAAIIVATSAVDVTGGLLAAGMLAAFGFIFLPRQKRKAIREYMARVDELRTDLTQALRAQFDTETQEALHKVHELIAPFEQLVGSEQETLVQVANKREEVADHLQRLRKEIETRFGEIRIGD